MEITITIAYDSAELVDKTLENTTGGITDAFDPTDDSAPNNIA